jgi:hypothetical protein
VDVCGINATKNVGGERKRKRNFGTVVEKQPSRGCPGVIWDEVRENPGGWIKRKGRVNESAMAAGKRRSTQ